MQRDVEIAVWRVEGQFSLAYGNLLRILLPADLEQNLNLLRLHKGELHSLTSVYREIFNLQSIFFVSHFKTGVFNLDSVI